MEKHVYHNGYDWIIATSPKEAAEIHIDYTDYNDQDENEWKQVSDEEFITADELVVTRIDKKEEKK